MASPQNLTLALEASAAQASAAIAVNGEVLFQSSHDAAHGHAAWMIGLADQVMAETGYHYRDLNQIIGGTGPGSFTGIRVALAAAKGFAITNRLHAKGLSSLAGLAGQVETADHVILSAIDSRRKTTFFQFYSPTLEAISPVIDGGIENALGYLKQGEMLENAPCIIIGHQAQDTLLTLKEQGIHAEMLDHVNPDASGLIKASIRNPELMTAPEPLYLAPPILGASSQ